MLDRPNLVNDESQFTLHSAPQQQTRVDRQRLDEDEDSRVSTDSDLDLETEDEVDCRSTFSCLLMRKLVAVELAQQQEAFREGLSPVGPLQLLVTAEDSYWAKMRRVSQWRESTLQSEAQSETQSEGPSETSSNYSPPAGTSRKRSLSDASLHVVFKRARITPLSSASLGSPVLPRVPPFHVDLHKSKSWADLGVYNKTVRAQQLAVQPYPSLGALHVCSACDTSFVSRQRLRRHGHGAWTPDACRAAVTYELE